MNVFIIDVLTNVSDGGGDNIRQHCWRGPALQFTHESVLIRNLWVGMKLLLYVDRKMIQVFIFTGFVTPNVS